MGLNEIVQIGNRIRKLRKEKGINQKQMAALLEIPYSTYSNYENNNREPNIENLKKIADIFGMTLDELLERKPSPPLVPKSVDFEITTIREFKDFSAFIGQYNGDEYTKEELEEIKKFAEFLKSKRNPKPDTPPQD